MTAYVSCHGGLSNTRPETFVPYYISEIKFYSKADENLRQSNELGVLARADLGLGEPNDRYSAGAPIPNYALSPDSSQDAALATYFEPSGGSLYFLPRATALCMADGKDEQGNPKACDKDEGVHYCSGLLGTLAWEDTALQGEIVMLACRGIIGRQNTSSRAIGADQSDTYQSDALNEFYKKWTAADDEGKARIWDDPELPEGTKVTMLTMPAVSGWVAVRQARWLVESDGDQAMLAYYLSGEQSRHRAAFDADPEIAASLARARAQVEAFKTADHETRVQTWLTLSDADRSYLAARDPEIQTWADNHGDRTVLLGGSGTVSDDQFAVTAAGVDTQFRTIATSIEALTGSEADAEAVAGLSAAYETLMTDIASLDPLAADDTDRLRAASGAYSAGASLGPELAAYGEYPDADTLAKLKDAAENLGSWIATLA